MSDKTSLAVDLSNVTEDLSYLKVVQGDLNSENQAFLTIEDVGQHEAARNILLGSISDYGDEAYLLHGLMSPAECQLWIDKGEEIGFGKIGTKKEYRNSTRIIFKSESLSRTLWERVEPFLKPITIQGDPHNVHVHGIESLLQGTWRPLKLNSLFRLCKYDDGGHFGPHFDSHLVESSKVRSFKTLMLYLNDDFKGGTTNFVDPEQTLHQASDGRFCAESGNILCSVQPEPGLALVFNHHRLHEGEQIRDGIKYILRTDIMFEKEVSGVSSEENSRDEQALLLVQEAERLENSGNTMAAMELYRKAFKMSPNIEKAF